MKNLWQGELKLLNCTCCGQSLWHRQAQVKSSCNLVCTDKRKYRGTCFKGTFETSMEQTYFGFWKALGTYEHFEQIVANNNRIEKLLPRWIKPLKLYFNFFLSNTYIVLLVIGTLDTHRMIFIEALTMLPFENLQHIETFY